MRRHHPLSHPVPVARQPGLQRRPGGRRGNLLAPYPARQKWISQRPSPQHHIAATAFLANPPPIVHRPDFTVGNHRHLHRRSHPGDFRPACRRPVAVFLGPPMHDQGIDSTRFQRLGALHRQQRIADPQPHLGGEGHTQRNFRPHRAGNGLQQLRLGQQGGTATMAEHRRRRTAKIQIDTCGVQTDQALRIGRHEMWIGTEQLHPHRRARQRTPGL